MGISRGRASRSAASSRRLTTFLVLLWVSSAPLHARPMAVEPCQHHHARHSDDQSAGGPCCLTTSCHCLGGGVVLGSCSPVLLVAPATLMVLELPAPPASVLPDGLERPPKPTSV